jgi:hypothetical protein
MPIRTSALRTLGAYANVYALESFMDELALEAGIDPVAFRLRHLKNPRARAVIEAAAGKAGWQPNRKGDGSRGRGIAFAQYKNLAAYVAVVADVNVDRRTGKVRVERAVAAVDAGLIINPDGVTNQSDTLRRAAYHHTLVGRLSDTKVPGSPGSRRRAAEQARRALARHWRRFAGTDRRRDRECDSECNGRAPA